VNCFSFIQASEEGDDSRVSDDVLSQLEEYSQLKDLVDSNQHAKKVSSSLWSDLGFASTHSQITNSLTNSLEFEEDDVEGEQDDNQNTQRKREQYRIKVDIRGNVTDELLEFIEQSGGKVIYASKEFDSIRAAMTGKLIDHLSRREEVYSISNAAKAHKYKLNTSQGVTDQRVNVAQAAHSNFKGKGVKIGVLSDSVNYLAQVQSTGDLPNVQVLDNVGGSGEGTAMLEIVYDMAPEAQLYFATAVRSDASYADNIIKLANAGCKVIVDDVVYYNEPSFEDGIIAQAVNKVAKQGVAYFAAGGNEGNKYLDTSQTWEGDYKGNNQPTTFNGKQYLDFHMFSASTVYNQISGSPDGCVLQWADHFNSPSSDYDLFILDSSNKIVTASTGTNQAFEAAAVPSGKTSKILVARRSGSARFMRISCFGYLTLQFSTNGATSGHATAEGGFGVGAIRITSSKTSFFNEAKTKTLAPDYFSSDGPRRIYFENGVAVTPGNFLSTGGKIRNKPDFLSTNGGLTATPGFSSFYGTSAAAPHAAALAALIFGAAPSISLDNLRNVLMTSAVDVGPKGRDVSSGVGVLDAVLIYQNLGPYLSSNPSPTTTPSGPCSSNPCKNGATCTAANGDFTCKCATGFKGKLCANRTPCSSNPCRNGATCTESDDTFTCKCAAGFKGTLCVNKDDNQTPTTAPSGPCSSNPCKNGATCTAANGDFTCKCATGFKGKLCANRTPCSSDPCKNGATCVESGDTFTCKCATGFKGTLCANRTPCSSNPCRNGATCTESGDTFTCKCPTGFKGTLCANKDSSQSQGLCSSDSCKNGGTCVEACDSFTCDCPSGFSGNFCEKKQTLCTPNPCQNGGKCSISQNTYSCACTNYFSGQNCEREPHVYTITAKTNSYSGSGTKGKISMRLLGQSKSSAVFEFKKGLGDGESFTLTRKMVNVLPIQSVYLSLDSSNDDWAFDSITIQVDNNQVYSLKQTWVLLTEATFPLTLES